MNRHQIATLFGLRIVTVAALQAQQEALRAAQTTATANSRQIVHLMAENRHIHGWAQRYQYDANQLRQEIANLPSEIARPRAKFLEQAALIADLRHQIEQHTRTSETTQATPLPVGVIPPRLVVAPVWGHPSRWTATAIPQRVAPAAS